MSCVIFLEFIHKCSNMGDVSKRFFLLVYSSGPTGARMAERTPTRRSACVQAVSLGHFVILVI